MSRSNPSAITVAITLDPENKFLDADVVLCPTIEEMRLLRTPEFEPSAKHFFQEIVKASRDKNHLSSLHFQGDSIGVFTNAGFEYEDLLLYFFQLIQYLLQENEFFDYTDIEDIEGYTFNRKETLHCSLTEIYADEPTNISFYALAVCYHIGLPAFYKRDEVADFIISRTQLTMDVLMVEQMKRQAEAEAQN